MKELGWDRKQGVKVLEGKWQDFINKEELLNSGGFDVVYTDTFSEEYQGMGAPSPVIILALIVTFRPS